MNVSRENNPFPVFLGGDFSNTGQRNKNRMM